MSELKYKVGDKVRIKSLDWYNENKDEYGYIDYGCYMFFPRMSKFCGKTFEIAEVYSNCYHVKELYAKTLDWTDEMIEGLVEEPVLSAPNITEGVYIHEKDMKCTTKYILPDGYIVKDENGNVINAQKIVLEKKKKEYPKTYEECCRVLGISDGEFMFSGLSDDEYDLFDSFVVIKRCRDAYWKIAGEEMGLGKPWKPNWDKCNGMRYCIYPILNCIRHDAQANEEYENRILAFPTEEMRDAFYENFKEEIEICKELL